MGRDRDLKENIRAALDRLEMTCRQWDDSSAGRSQVSAEQYAAVVFDLLKMGVGIEDINSFVALVEQERARQS